MARRMHHPVLRLQQHYVAANNGAQVIRQAISAGGGAPKQTWSWLEVTTHRGTAAHQSNMRHRIIQLLVLGSKHIDKLCGSG